MHLIFASGFGVGTTVVEIASEVPCLVRLLSDTSTLDSPLTHQ
jgi:hypothetical protein